jgi:Flp pilus assembly protein protease CpaA
MILKNTRRQQACSFLLNRKENFHKKNGEKMVLLLLRQAIVLLATGISAYTDWKTGLILDKVTFPLIAIGIGLSLLEQQWIAFAVAAIVFALGYAFYYAGKIGGGDVKLFTGIALVLPFFGKEIFLLDALLLSAVLAVIAYTVFFAGKFVLKNGLRLEENKKGIANAVMVGAFLLLYFFLIFQLHALSLYSIALLAIPLLFGLVFMALEKGIRREFFLKKVKLQELEEDELLATDFEEQKTLKLLDLKFKGVLGKKEIEKLKTAGIQEVFVYRNAPRFAPFFFLGCLVAMVFPNLFSLFFLRL